MEDQNINPSQQPYRCAIGDPAAGVHCSEPSAAQHGAHLVDFLEGLLLHFDCGEEGEKDVKINVSFAKQTSSSARGSSSSAVTVY